MRKFKSGFTYGEALQIEALYQDSAISWAGNKSPKGIYIHFSIVNIEGGFVRTMPQKNFKIRFVELSRKNAKALADANHWMSDKKDILFRLFAEGDQQGLIHLIEDRSLHG